MRLKQWFYSILLFVASLAILLFSSDFFGPENALPVATSLPASAVPQCNLIILPNQDYYPYLKEHFQKAQSRIIGTVYLFKTAAYRNNEPADLLRELIAAHKRKVSVEIVIDVASDNVDSNEINRRAADRLKRAGVTVHLDRPDIATHAKTFVIDDRYCFVGSHNFTHAAMTMNRELSIFVDSPETAQKITEFIQQIPRNFPPVVSSTGDRP